MIQTSELSGPKMEPLQGERGGSKHGCARWEMAHLVLTIDFCTAKHNSHHMLSISNLSPFAYLTFPISIPPSLSHPSLAPRVSIPDFVSQLWRNFEIQNGKPGFEASPTQPIL